MCFHSARSALIHIYLSKSNPVVCTFVITLNSSLCIGLVIVCFISFFSRCMVRKESLSSVCHVDPFPLTLCPTRRRRNSCPLCLLLWRSCNRRSRSLWSARGRDRKRGRRRYDTFSLLSLFHCTLSLYRDLSTNSATNCFTDMGLDMIDYNPPSETYIAYIIFNSESALF